MIRRLTDGPDQDNQTLWGKQTVFNSHEKKNGKKRLVINGLSMLNHRVFFLTQDEKMY